MLSLFAMTNPHNLAVFFSQGLLRLLQVSILLLLTTTASTGRAATDEPAPPDSVQRKFRLSNVPGDTVAPTVLETVPAAGSTATELLHLEVIFSENVIGVDPADLLVNGVPATNIVVVSPRDYIFYFPQPPNGPVKFSWATNHRITDLGTPANAFTGQDWTCTLHPTRPRSQVIISEFLADNTSGLRDDDAARSDWIELLNLGTEALDLGGWHLTDEATNLAKWRFPAVTLAPNVYLLVWASEKDRTNSATGLHANFRLATEGEYLALVDPTTNVISSFAPNYPPQKANISYGRDRVDPALAGYLLMPTPGTTNAVSGPGFAPDPIFSINGGVFNDESLRVAISAPSGQIRYTLDGAAPTNSSPVYTQPFVLSSNTVINARVYKEGLLPSQIVIQTYSFLSASMTNFSSNLPLLIINTAGKSIPQDRRIRAHISSFDVKDGRARLLSQPDFESAAQIEVRGQTSAGFPKLPYNIEINDPSGNDVEAPLLGLPSESDWVLHNPYTDKCLMNNVLTFELNRQMGHYSPRTVFVEVFLKSTPGRLNYPVDYRGVYVLMEKIKIDKNRVDLRRLAHLDASEPDISGGYIIKKDKDSPGDRNLSTLGGGGFGGQALKYHEPKPREISRDQQTWIRNYLVQFERCLYATNWLTRVGTNHYAHYIDRDSFVDYHWIVEFTKQIDGYRLSNYMSKDRGDKLRMEPIWDWNLAWGNADYLEGERTNGWYDSLISDSDHIWLRRLISGTAAPNGRTGDADFNQKIADRWSVLRTNIMKGTNVAARIDEIASYLSEAAAREFVRWPRLGTYVWPNPRIYSQPRTYVGIITNMKAWTLGRYEWIDNQFLRVPELSHPGGRIEEGTTVSMSARTGAIYYTMDGTDPRLPGGAISPAAKAFDGRPLALRSNARLVARAFDGANKWSGPAASTFAVQTPPLAITEIMYNAAPPTARSTNATEDFSFIELRNVGNAPLSLTGFRFTRGIEYAFTLASGVTTLAPGAYTVLVKNRTSFSSRYPNVTSVAGEYSGSLDNNGERLTLEGPVQETVADFAYDPAWHPSTDGHGRSLVLRAVNMILPADLSARWAWRPSTQSGGSPGQADPPEVIFPTVLINEIMTDPTPPRVDAVELFNSESTSANISGWFISDDLREPKKYRIPDRTVIPAGGYLLLDERQFNAAGAGSFSFNRFGEQAYLFSGNGVDLTGYAHGFSFGGAAENVSFGRYVTTSGEAHFVAQRQATLGAANSGPLTGPVVLSEVMYQPRAIGSTNNTVDEFIEIQNITGQSVSLYDPAASTNRWRLRGGPDFNFPMNSTLPPNGLALVVNFNPATEPNTLAGFRARYGLDPSVTIYGPYQGNLSNEGERIELQRPGQVAAGDAAATAPYILVDAVAYEDVAPWPTDAAGRGSSLQRRAIDQYGDDPINWQAALPTPGRSAIGVGGDSDSDGLPDEWELAQLGNLSGGPVDDPDSDGVSNLNEFIAGTGPRDASSYLKVESMQAVGTIIRITFKAVAGKSYSVLFRDGILSGPWTKLTDVPAGASTRDVRVTDTTGRPTRFYRLVTPQAP